MNRPGDIPPSDSLAVGNPANVIRTLSPDETRDQALLS